jgi:peptidoglycan hydrolase-like protein with peptidoglycan-binding domain
MRSFGAVCLSAYLLIPLSAVGQSEKIPAAENAVAEHVAQSLKFHVAGILESVLRAHATAPQAQDGTLTAGQAAPAGETIRMAAAAARKRAPTSSAPKREASSIPPDDRLAIQVELAWTGDYRGLINGEVDEKTTAAVKSFQKNRKFKETGVLNTQERALLSASAKAKQAQVGWTVVDDPVTGARLGIPSKQAPNKAPAKAGTRWVSAQGQVQIETFKIREPGTTLASVYDQQKKEPSTRRLELNLLRPDFFILAGMQGLKKFYVRADIKGGEVRGITVLYDQATENIMEPVAVVMSSAFSAFPSVSSAQIGAVAKRKVEYGTGIIVSSAGHILADRELTEGCNVIAVGGFGNAERTVDDASKDLALLRVYGVSDLLPAIFAPDAAGGPELTLLGITDPQMQEGGIAVSSITAKLKGEAIDPVPQLGFSGAAVLDAQNRVAGVVELKAPLIATIGASNAQPQATIVPAPVIRAFLDAQKVPPATGRWGLDRTKSSIVRVICVRK